MRTQDQDLTIKAAPTKEFFIYMLTKDIPLLRAILDLVDNCVDGALRVRTDGNYRGLRVRITLNGERLKIEDNCGGIPVDQAQKYAFRFGRDPLAARTDFSVGGFGVGMKRALFKIGKLYDIESTTQSERFLVKINLDEWIKDRGPDWQFEFDSVKKVRNVPANDRGTVITVTRLHEAVALEFASPFFEKQLMLAIASAHQESMDKGLSIAVNGNRLEFRPALLKESDQIRPATYHWRSSDDPPISVSMWAGLGEPKESISRAGWYIFCNARLVLEADQTIVTGWGEEGEITVPRFHNQYGLFRGYLALDCADASKLPLNTTKTGVDADSPFYVSIRQEMIKRMKPVITFLNRLKEEKEGKEGQEREERRDPGPLELAVNVAALKRLPAVLSEQMFNGPKPVSKPAGPVLARVEYYKPDNEIEVVRKKLKARSRREVGEKTFEYFVRMECGEE